MFPLDQSNNYPTGKSKLGKESQIFLRKEQKHENWDLENIV